MEDFLASLLDVSTNPTVKAAAAFHLAQLYDNALQIRRELANIRKRFQDAGLLKAQPYVERNLDLLEKRQPVELAARRDELIKLVLAKYSDHKSWSKRSTSCKPL